MANKPIRIGLIGVGANMRARHVPGFRELPDVELVAVCNRRPSSTQSAARELGIERTYENWQDLVRDPGIDAVVIGTWPYLHCPITLQALEAGKHVLTEARMAMNASEARQMLAASREHKDLVVQIVPSPFGLKGHDVMVEHVEGGYLGKPREGHVYSLTGALADPATPLSWRQDVALSGYNLLTLRIVHETALRWMAPPRTVIAQVHAFTSRRIDPESGVLRSVGTPDSVQVLATLADGARALYHISGVTPFGQGAGIWLYGTEGVLHYDLNADRIQGANRGSPSLSEIPIPATKARGWRVEAEFIDAIRGVGPVSFTTFQAGVEYMEFTEAVARSAQEQTAVDVPFGESEAPRT